MQLTLELPASSEKILRQVCREKIEYCVPFDLQEGAQFCKDGFVVVTRQRLIVLKGKQILFDLPLKTLSEIACEGLINCGILTATINDEPQVLCRFTTGNLARMSYVARGIRLFMQGNFRRVESKETEHVCQKCGRMLHGTTVCSHCEGKKESFRRLMRICKPYAPRFAVIWVLMLATAGIALYMQQWQKLFIDRHLVPRSGTVKDIALFLGVTGGLIAVDLVINITKRYLGVLLGSKMSASLRRELFCKVQDLSLSYLDSRKPGDLMNRIVGDTEQVRGFMENVFTNMFTYIITFIGALVLMLIMNWKLALLSMVFVPVIWVAFRVYRRKMHRLFHLTRKRDDQLNSGLQDVLQGIKVVKTFGKEEYEAGRFSKLSHNFAHVQERGEVFWAVFNPCIGIMLNLGTTIVLLLGGVNALSGTGFTVGEMAQYIGYANMLFGPLGWFTQLPRMILNLKISLSRIDDIMAQTPEIETVSQAKQQAIQGQVEFQDVTFGYRSYEPVLDSIRFQVKKGETIGLVGSSGSGKSTMINLIMRLYDVDEGAVTVDGTDIKLFDPACYHSQIGVVLQENYLFSGTILDNIRFSKPEAALTEVISAAKTAGAHDFICKFPDGYNTMVGEKGHRLSGGERQRIAIARAVLGNPSLLILDEATSSLDTESEFMIQKALERLTKGRTTFAIAHRLSTLRGADRIFVINDHRIAEMGTHQELMELGGIYKGLVDAQLEMHAIRSAQ